MKSFLLLLIVAIISPRQVSTLTYTYQTHFLKELPKVRNWTKQTNTVTIRKESITISDKQNSSIYSVTKGPVFREEKNYNVYHAARNKISYMIMVPLNNSYINVMNLEDSTVWMLSNIDF